SFPRHPTAEPAQPAGQKFRLPRFPHPSMSLPPLRFPAQVIVSSRYHPATVGLAAPVPPRILADFPLDPSRPGRYTTSMTDPTDTPNIDPSEIAEPLSRAIGERYLTYALSTIMN